MKTHLPESSFFLPSANNIRIDLMMQTLHKQVIHYLYVSFYVFRLQGQQLFEYRWAIIEIIEVKQSFDIAFTYN